MNKLMWLGGLLPEIIMLIREVVKAIRSGHPSAAAKAAQRAAEMQAFRVRQRSKGTI